MPSAPLVLSIPPSALPSSEYTPQLLPFHLSFSGPAPVSTYFLTRPQPADASTSSSPSKPLLLSAFRGRQVVGQDLVLPEGYSGVVLDIPAASGAGAMVKSTAGRDEEGARAKGKGKGKVAEGEITEEIAVAMEEEKLAGAGSRRASPRKRVQTNRFAGPPPKKAKVVAKKFKIDSDDSESDEEAETEPSTPSVLEAASSTSSAFVSIASASTSSSSVVPSPTPDLPPPGPPVSPAASSLVPDDRELDSSHLDLTTPAGIDAYADVDVLPTLPPRTITVLSSFPSITLWSPDDPVDEVRDEFFRCFGKGGWVEMAGALHEEEED